MFPEDLGRGPCALAEDHVPGSIHVIPRMMPVLESSSLLLSTSPSLPLPPSLSHSPSLSPPSTPLSHSLSPSPSFSLPLSRYTQCATNETW